MKTYRLYTTSLMAISILLLMSSCYSTGKMLEAQALEKGEQLVQIKLEATIIDQGDSGDLFRVFDAFYAYGVNSKYDLGFLISTGGSIGMHNKLELLDREKDDISIGFDARVYFFSRLNGQLTPAIYYTHTKPGKRKVMINSAINIETFNLNFSTGTYISPNITIARQQFEKNWLLGYTLGYNVFDSRSYSHSLSIAYNFRY